jgi:hypothetical protein
MKYENSKEFLKSVEMLFDIMNSYRNHQNALVLR